MEIQLQEILIANIFCKIPHYLSPKPRWYTHTKAPARSVSWLSCTTCPARPPCAPRRPASCGPWTATPSAASCSRAPSRSASSTKISSKKCPCSRHSRYVVLKSFIQDLSPSTAESRPQTSAWQNFFREHLHLLTESLNLEQ